MYSVRNRLNVIWTLTMFVLAVGAGTMAATSMLMSYVRPPSPTASIQAVVAPTLFRGQSMLSGRPVDRSLVRVNGTADFSSCFSWNTKQVYVYAVVEYSTPKYSKSEITVYDTIITKKEDAVVHLDNVIEYPTDHIEPNQIGGRNAVLRLKYHVMLYSGLSPQYEVEEAATPFTFPAVYAGVK